MLKFFEKLRTAPEDVKRTFAVSVSGVLTVIILLASISLSDPLIVKAEKKDKKKDLASPFTALVSDVGTSFTGIREEMSKIPFKEFFSAMTSSRGNEATSSVIDTVAEVSDDAALLMSVATRTVSSIVSTTTATTTKTNEGVEGQTFSQ